MARRPNICLYVVLFMFGMTPMPLHAAPAPGNAATVSASACANPSWIDVRCYGATGNGVTDDTAAINRALAADRSYMLADGPQIAFSALNFGDLEMINRRTRLATRFNDGETAEALRRLSGTPLDAATALDRGLVTFAPDELDWEDEIRLALEERASLSPDALTGMEASLRFAGAETVATKIFARLSAWQNWIFSRPNAVGEHSALKNYGSGAKPRFDWKRV